MENGAQIVIMIVQNTRIRYVIIMVHAVMVLAVMVHVHVTQDGLGINEILNVKVVVIIHVMDVAHAMMVLAAMGHVHVNINGKAMPVKHAQIDLKMKIC